METGERWSALSGRCEGVASRSDTGASRRRTASFATVAATYGAGPDRRVDLSRIAGNLSRGSYSVSGRLRSRRDPRRRGCIGRQPSQRTVFLPTAFSLDAQTCRVGSTR